MNIETIIGPVTFTGRDGSVLLRLDLENAYIDASPIEDLRQPDEVTQVTQMTHMSQCWCNASAANSATHSVRIRVACFIGCHARL